MEHKKHIVSMIASEPKITLITVGGEILDLKLDGPYDTTRLSEYLLPRLTGSNAVEIDMSEYLTFKAALTPDYEEDGVVIKHIIDGKEVQGIFYPQKVQVSVQFDEEEPITIPKVEKLSAQMNRAYDDKSPAVRNFLKRLAPVVKDRLHSAEDLMDFIERSELPLTNDGMIVGYKRVNHYSHEKGVYVDCHTGKVKQRLGSVVWMDIDGVDPSRNRSCSHGLHVANLGYLRSFGGQATLIVLVDPADFIAVPHGETNKCRVMKYLVVGVLGNDAHNKVRDSHIEGDVEFETLISDVISGNHIQPVERVKVGQNGQLLETVILENGVPILESKPEVKRSGKSLKVDEQIKKDQKDIRKMAKNTKATSSGRHVWDSASFRG